MPIELDTPDKLEYRFYPAGYGVFNFKIRATNDAHMALTMGPHESEPMIEVFIGGWKNTKSVIRKNKTKPEKAEADTPDILNGNEYRGFWIKWMDGVITVGREGDVAAFMSWYDPDLFPISHVGVCTGWGASGSWIIEQSAGGGGGGGGGGGWAPPPFGGGGGGGGYGAPCWVPASAGNLPQGAIAGGQDGEQLYVARARHEGALIPGKFVPSHGVCYIAWAGGEHPHNDFEVLCGGNVSWVPTSGNNIPNNAIPCGEAENGEPLFVGRAHHEGTITIGKVQESHGVCYIPYGGQELGYKDYEILTSN